MHIDTFTLERNQSLYENTVEINLTESGIHPWSIKEFLTDAQIEHLISAPLGYGYTEGLPNLRKAIATWYPSASANNIVVTHGASEANLITILALIDPGDEMIFIVPNFMQISGLANAIGVTVNHFSLQEQDDWQPDLNALEAQVGSRTKLISTVNPGNPTGAVFSEASVTGLLDLARRHKLWLLVDEIYRGAEIDLAETASFYGRYEKVIVTSSLSKSFAMPGLRLGWAVAPDDVIKLAMHRQDYTTIGTGVLPQILAEKVMQPTFRAKVLKRGRSVLDENLRIFEEWAEIRRDVFAWRRPQAGGMVFLKYNLPIGSDEFSKRLREEESVFVVAGSWFGLDGHIRLGFGVETDHLVQGLERLGRLVDRILSEMNDKKTG